MPLIEWDEGMCLGVPEIDEEHKKLVELLNKLVDVNAAGERPDVLGRIVDQLVAYTAYHFLHEEKLFLGTDYPDADFHVAEHRALTVRVLDIQRKIRLGGVDGLSEELLVFLKEWLIHHTQGVDRGYVPYISKEKASV